MRIHRFNQACQSDKVLCVFDIVTEIPKIHFLYDLHFNEQRLLLLFLLRRFTNVQSFQFNSLKLCSHCDTKLEIEEYFEHNGKNFRSISKRILLDEPDELRKIIPIIKTLL
jgi:hypothetical protein